MTTRAQATQADAQRNHVFNNLFRLNPGSKISESLLALGIYDADAIASLTPPFIDSLKYREDPTDASSALRPLPRGDRQLLKIFVCFAQHLNSLGDYPDDWGNITLARFRQFRHSSEMQTRMHCMDAGTNYEDIAAASQAAANAAAGKQ